MNLQGPGGRCQSFTGWYLNGAVWSPAGLVTTHIERSW